MTNKQTKISGSYEISPVTQKGEMDINLPDEATNELGLATARLIDTFNNSSKRVFDMFCNSMSTLGQPIGEIIKGKTAAIELANQSLYMKLAMTKETNMRKLLAYAAEEFEEKVVNGEDIPNHLVETDEILLIEENASLTSNEEFLKLWAKLYTEEACKPGTVSRRTIKLVETLDASIIKIFEENILPYCSSDGFYWGNKNDLNDILTIADYDLLVKSDGIIVNPKKLNYVQSVKLNNNYNLCVYPNYYYHAYYKYSNYRLTTSGLEIYKILKDKIKMPQDMHLMFENIKEASKDWQIATPYKDKIHIKRLPNNDEKFIICDNDNNVVYPETSPFRTLQEFIYNASQNIEVIKDAK